MKYTSSEINKMIKTYTEQMGALVYFGNQSNTFVAATTEDVESVRPEYDFAKTEEQIVELQAKIRKLKHALNIFNSTTIVPGLNMTIDELLVALPQWNHSLSRYAALKDKLPKTRKMNIGGANSNIEYTYINYDLDEVKKAYTELNEKIIQAQLALDTVNSTYFIEIED